MVIIVC